MITLRRLFPSLAPAAAVLMFLGITAPVAHAELVTYFNFNDGNLISDPPGVQSSTITPQFLTPSFVTGTTVNLALGDTTGAGSALRVTFSSGGGGGNAKSLQFTVNTVNLSNLSLSYATEASSGGHIQTLSYSTNGTTFTNVGTFTPTTSFTLASFNNLPTAVDNQPSVTFRITITGVGGNNNQFNDFDNIQLTGNAVPEPATVVGGLLGALGLCWHQRRRLLGIAQRLRLFRKPAAV
jgi:hypothetical protein